MPSFFIDIDPRELLLPSSMQGGADPWKLQRQIALFGASQDHMPPPCVYETADGAFLLYNGVTRATRIAMLMPGRTIRVEVMGKLKIKKARFRTIGDTIP